MVFKIMWIRLIRSQVYKFNAYVCAIRSPVALSWALLFRDPGAAPLLSIKIRFLDGLVKKRLYKYLTVKIKKKVLCVSYVPIG